MALDLYDFAAAPSMVPPVHIGPAVCERERRILGAIRRYTQDFGYGPSVRDLQAETGISSTCVVAYWITRLERKGYVTLTPGKSRTLRLTRLALPAAGGGA